MWMSRRAREPLLSFHRPGHVARLHSKFRTQSGKVAQDLFKCAYIRINVSAKIMWVPPKVIASAALCRPRHAPLDHLAMERMGNPELTAARAQEMACGHIRAIPPIHWKRRIPEHSRMRIDQAPCTSQHGLILAWSRAVYFLCWCPTIDLKSNSLADIQMRCSILIT